MVSLFFLFPGCGYPVDPEPDREINGVFHGARPELNGLGPPCIPVGYGYSM